MKLVPYNDPILYAPTIPFDFSNPPEDPQVYFQKLKNLLITDHKGLGLSSNQVGLPYSVFVFGDYTNPNSIVGVFNPTIVSSWGSVEMEEGCLSFPGFLMRIERPSNIRVRYTTYNGVRDTQQLSGLSARVFQHEVKHLEGRPFFDGSSKLKLDMAAKRCYKKYGIVYKASELMRL